VLACVFLAERVTDAVWVVQQRADDELGGCRGDLLWKNGRAGAVRADGRRDASALPHRSRGVSAAEQVREATPELVLVQAWPVLTLGAL
jgi:hypothetical protein